MQDILGAHKFRAITRDVDLGLGAAPLGVVFSHNQLGIDRVQMHMFLKEAFATLADGEQGNCFPGAKKMEIAAMTRATKEHGYLRQRRRLAVRKTNKIF